ncbi:MAG: CHAT domain-containing protein [Pyrinomonadaceae bacterium]
MRSAIPTARFPQADEEVAAINRIFQRADIYTGKDATVARVSDTQTRTAFVHFATHGMINSQDPKESYLLLAGKPDRLTVRDLVEDAYRLSFAGTRLVTLSACETNIGGFDSSVVYSSLSRAFSKAGAPTVVASLWSVNDAAMRDTMTIFYRELAAGKLKCEALRQAQLSLGRLAMRV